MLSKLLTALTVLPWYGALGGQIPVIEGILGGIPSVIPDTVKKADTLPSVTTPGKLRIVENSGVCGRCSLLLPFSYV